MRTIKIAVEDYNKLTEEIIAAGYEIPATAKDEFRRVKRMMDIDKCTANLRHWYETKLHKAKVEQYWMEHTEEHKQLNDQMDELKQVRLDKTNELEDEVGKKLSSFLGSLWSCAVHNYGFTLQYLDRLGERIFGLEIEGYFRGGVNSVFNTDGPMLEINYPCGGSFNPLANKEKVQYLQDMAKLVSNQSLLNELTQLYIDYHDFLYLSYEEQSKLKKLLENPNISE